MAINDRIRELMSMGDRLNDRLIASYEKELIKAYRESLRNVRSILAQLYARYGDDVTYQFMQQRDRLTSIEKEIRDELRKLKSGSDTIIRNSIKDNLNQNYYLTGYIYESELKASLGFGALRPSVVEASILNPVDRIKWPERNGFNVEVLNRRVRQSVTQGLIQGEGYVNTARMLKGNIERTAKDTLRIVRTESKRAQTTGNIIGLDRVESYADKNNIKTERVWIATFDGRTRDQHLEMDGNKANDEDIFTFPDGTTTTGPGLSGVAAQDIACRCTIIVEIAQIPHKLRRSRIENESVVVPYQSFNQWKEYKKVA